MLRQPGWFNLLQCLQEEGKAGAIPRAHISLPPAAHHKYNRNSQEIKKIQKNIKNAIKIKISRFPCNEWLSCSYICLDRSRCQVLRQETACSSQPLSLPSPQHLHVRKFLLIACQGGQHWSYRGEPGSARGQQGCWTRMPCLIPPSRLCFSPPTS